MAVSRLGRTTGRTATWAQSLAPTIAIDATHNECEDQPCFHQVSVGHMFNEIERNMGGGPRIGMYSEADAWLRPTRRDASVTVAIAPDVWALQRVEFSIDSLRL